MCKCLYSKKKICLYFFFYCLYDVMTCEEGLVEIFRPYLWFSLGILYFSLLVSHTDKNDVCSSVWVRNLTLGQVIKERSIEVRLQMILENSWRAIPPPVGLVGFTNKDHSQWIFFNSVYLRVSRLTGRKIIFDSSSTPYVTTNLDSSPLNFHKTLIMLHWSILWFLIS